MTTGVDKDLDENAPETAEEQVESVQDTGGNGECAEALAAKDEEIKSLQDRVLRAAAEMENTRKRLEREKSEGICFANESLLRDLLPIVDNLERAIVHGEEEGNFQALLEGVRLTLKSFGDTLGKYGCKVFESMGKPFDPNFHEAVMQQESSEHPEKTVVQEFQKGYTLKDRLLRPA
ncbi:MAG: nucleotide exchange factor GrpE, partial [Desulfobacteraceae bacterium]|nr:nucleotide exchange factor GrpE [Desulfobacteraceae bacterium]